MMLSDSMRRQEVSTHVPCMAHKEALSAEIAKQIEAYEASGNHIREFGTGESNIDNSGLTKSQARARRSAVRRRTRGSRGQFKAN